MKNKVTVAIDVLESGGFRHTFIPEAPDDVSARLFIDLEGDEVDLPTEIVRVDEYLKKRFQTKGTQQ